MRRLVITALCLTAAACEPPVPSAPASQSVRPAKLFQVAPLVTRERYQFVSRVAAAQTVDLAFEVAGPLAQLPVRAGASVAKGALLAALDPTDFELNVREAEVAADLAAQDLERKQSLLARRGISQAAVDDAVANVALTTVKLEQAREARKDARLVAPFDAYIARRFVDRHTNMRVGEPVVRLLDLREIHLLASVPETLLATVSADRIANLEARFAFAPELSFALRYLENSGEADPVAQTYQVRFAMPRPSSWNILPGMTATVSVELNAPPTGPLRVAVPTSALLTDAEQAFYVWIYDPDSQRVSRRNVTVGPASAAGLIITGGLSGGELIVTTGASALQDGMQIEPLGTPQTDPTAL